MSDPKRLLDEGGDDFGASLLRAGRTLDSEQAQARRIALLGASAALTATAGAAKGGLFQGLLTKWVGLGLLTTAIAAGIAARALSTPEHPVTPSVRAVLAEHPIQQPAAPAPKANDEAKPAAVEPPSAPGIAIDSLPSATPEEAPLAAKPGAARVPSTPSTLADEVSSLREAREALAAGQTQRAFAALDAYVQRFPGGHLGLEAEELRIEALARSGNSAAAGARARAFLAAHPTSPYAPRLRALAFPSP
jgi:hypothetical protein